MRLIGGYLIREISLGIVAVLLGFLGLFAFFDLINELEDIGQGGYRLYHAVLYVLLSLPGHVYELMPVAALIGCIYALSRFAGNSEFTAMRAAGMSRFLALRSIIGIGVVLAILTAVAGEWVSPVAEQLAQKLRLNVLGASKGGTFRSGLWIKDSVKDSSGKPLRLHRQPRSGRQDGAGRDP
jgi:lipopolysaccharide export system permease protein